MKLTDFAARLGAFGLSRPEGLVYLHLSRMGPSLASEVARAADIKRTEVYELLKSLEKKKFVEKTIERPTRFVAIPIESLLDRSLESHDARVAGLRAERDDLVKTWPRAGGTLEKEGERYSVFQGREQCAGLLDRLIGGAKEEILVAASKRWLARQDLGRLAPPLVSAAKGGAWVRLMTEIDQENLNRIGQLADGCHVRHVDLPGYYQVVIVDSRQIALFVSIGSSTSTKGADETALWLNSPDFVLAEKALFDLLWERGVDLEGRRRELEGGASAVRAELLRGRWVRYNRMKDLIRGARRSVVIVGCENDRQRWARAGVQNLLAARAGDGVRIQIGLRSGATVDIQGAEGFPDAASGASMILIVDEQEALLVSGQGEDLEALAYEGEWSVWTNDARIVGDLTSACLGGRRAGTPPPRPEAVRRG